MRPKLTQAESFILGIGAKMLTIAGPIAYGVSASVVYGLIYWITALFSLQGGGLLPPQIERLDQIGQAF